MTLTPARLAELLDAAEARGFRKGVEACTGLVRNNLSNPWIIGRLAEMFGSLLVKP
jgi:hypothetical protein